MTQMSVPSIAERALMIGWIFHHPHLGIGKVVAKQGPSLRIRYIETGQELAIGVTAFQDGSLSRKRLTPQMKCRRDGEVCTIKRSLASTETEPYSYEVSFPDGRVLTAMEIDLDPLPGQIIRDPLLQLQGLEPQEYGRFNVREWMVRSYAQLLKRGAGFRALLSSRIDLHPHQAYVAGEVIHDARRRYILADEVGLGKTIEAGIIIHDLLMQNPRARILVLCPGELTQQWLCELYSKFGGHVFKLLDLHAPATIRAAALDRAIVSTTLATFRLAKTLQECDWDLVVVDEVHHLLYTPALYQFVEALSRRTPSLLLLSAIPAQRREDEFLRLLRLLEPERYQAMDAPAREQFRQLYAAQEDIGRRLRRVDRALEAVTAGEGERDEVLRLLHRLASLAAFAEDTELREWVNRIAALQEDLVSEVRQLLEYVGQQYRINRRILRNRRKRLIDQEQLQPVERRFSEHAYLPEQIEREVLDSAEELIRELDDSVLEPTSRGSFVRMLQQSLISAATAVDLLQVLANPASTQRLSDEDAAYVAAGHLTGYAEWIQYRDLLCRAVRPHLPEELVARASRRSHAWLHSLRGHGRRDRLLDLLRERQVEESRPKLLLFAGFPGACTWIAEEVRHEFGDAAVREFRYDMPRQEKEAAVLEFRNDPSAWILVSDETGGEGRNFQFVDEIIHLDTPSIARIEQRIGRLDRLGRAEIRPDVHSHVLVAEDTLESALVHCYVEGVGVYRESISGLEFALRDIEETIVRTACEGGAEAVRAFASEARQIVVQERNRDDADALFDQASFNILAAGRLQRVASSQSTERDLQHSFVRYVKTVASRYAVREENDPRLPGGAVWTFKPDDFVRGVLPAESAERPEIFRPRTGTFRRKIAQERLDLEFFCIGNPFFDLIIESLWKGSVGRTYAVACEQANYAAWEGLEFVFRAEPNWQVIQGSVGLLNRAATLFPVKPFHVFINGEDEAESDERAAELLSIRRKLRMPDRGRQWIDLTVSQVQQLAYTRWGDNWQEGVQDAYEKARLMAREYFVRRLEQDLAAERQRVDELLRQSIRYSQEADEIEALRAFQSSLTDWDLAADSAGFLVINPGRSQ
jgi:ATP-dependent helicase HepA